MPENHTIYCALLRQNLTAFIEKTFHTLNPGATYLPNWHIEAIASHLEEAEEEEGVSCLLINMPPRYMKSLCVSVAFPAWLLGRDPTKRIMVASYSQSLSTKHSLDCRNILTSPWYRNVFPATLLRKDQNEKNKFMTLQNGFRFATSIGGTATGEGGDVLIVDDPHNPLQAMSDTQRVKAFEWFKHTFMSRLNNKKKGVIIVVMQRLHTEDLSGMLLSQKNTTAWKHLILPAIAEKDHIIATSGFKHVFKEQDCLHPERESRHQLHMMKEMLGSASFAAQYQQHPLMLKNGLIEPYWIKRYKIPPEEGKIVISWDMAVKLQKTNDYSVCSIWKQTTQGHFLLYVLRKRMAYPELKHTVVNLSEQWRPTAILIEDKASGQSLLQDVKHAHLFPYIAILPKGDKYTRFMAVTPQFEAGRVYLPETAEWLIDFEQELFSFPTSPHDDQVDSLSQYLEWSIKKERVGRYNIRGC